MAGESARAVALQKTGRGGAASARRRRARARRRRRGGHGARRSRSAGPRVARLPRRALAGTSVRQHRPRAGRTAGRVRRRQQGVDRLRRRPLGVAPPERASAHPSRRSAPRTRRLAVPGCCPGLDPELVKPVICLVRPEPVFGWVDELMLCSTANIVTLLSSRPKVLEQGRRFREWRSCWPGPSARRTRWCRGWPRRCASARTSRAQSRRAPVEGSVEEGGAGADRPRCDVRRRPRPPLPVAGRTSTVRRT